MTDLEVDCSAGIASQVFEIAEVELSDAGNFKRSRRDSLLEDARAELLRRKQRRQVLGHLGILNDPAWDILLELYIADITGCQLYASVVGTDAAIPQSTALRWLTVLEKEGLLRRRFDNFDKRRQWVGLTPFARSLMERHFTMTAHQ